MSELLFKIFVTPENVFNLLLGVSFIVGECIIFNEFGEKWWKALIPFYGTYILYKNLWKSRFVFLVELISSFAGTICLMILRKHLFSKSFDAIKILISEQKFDIDINLPLLLACIAIFCVTYILTFTMQRITYWKLTDKFELNILFKIGTFIIPDIFLLIDVIYYKRSQKLTPTEQ